MLEDELKTVTCAFGSAIYSGKWSSDPHAVTVRYRGRQVTLSNFISRSNAELARKILKEMIENDPHLQRHAPL
jgi:hypothetical protein